MVLARVSVRRGLAAASPKFRRVTEVLQCKAERAVPRGQWRSKLDGRPRAAFGVTAPLQCQRQHHGRAEERAFKPGCNDLTGRPKPRFAEKRTQVIHPEPRSRELRRQGRKTSSHEATAQKGADHSG